MCDHIRHQVALDYPHEGGSIRSSLEQVARQTKQPMEKLIAQFVGPTVQKRDRLPDPGKYHGQIEYLYLMHLSISSTSDTDQHGIPLMPSNVEMKAYMELEGISLLREEIEVIRSFNYARVDQIRIECSKSRSKDK